MPGYSRHWSLSIRRKSKALEIVNVPVAAGRIWRTQQVGSDNNPLVGAARLVIQGREQAAVRTLRDWYREHFAWTFSEWTGMEFRDARLGQKPPWAVPMPWWNDSCDERARKAKQNLAAEAGIAFTSDFEATLNWPVFGPVSAELPEREVGRIKRILKAWEEDQVGYREAELPTVRRLQDSGGSVAVWEVKSGNHRFACAAALEVTHLRCTVVSTVDKKDLNRWPGVRAQVFSRNEADALFRMVAGTV